MSAWTAKQKRRENERVDDQNSAFVGPQNLVGYLFDGEIVVFIGENPPKIQIHASTESTPYLFDSFSPGGGLKYENSLIAFSGVASGSYGRFPGETGVKKVVCS